MPGFEEIIRVLQAKTENQNGIFVYLPEITEFQKTEIEFHDAIHQDEEEIHQLNTLRNRYYHDYFKKQLNQLPTDSVILEIGAGSGYDLIPLLKKNYSIIVSDISVKTVKSIKSKVEDQFPQYKNQVIYLVADGQNLPFDDDSIDAVYLVATLHHFENQDKAIAEIKRITKKGGLMILAMEPSKFMMWFTKLFKNSKNLRLYQAGSAADETHAGYSLKDLLRITCLPAGRRNCPNIRIIDIKRVWLIQGFIHYGLEAAFRLFKLKKRLKMPWFLEWFILTLDEILLKIPYVNQLHWHWLAIVKKI